MVEHDVARLLLARELLTEDGVLICAIDDNEQVNLGALLKDVFDEGGYEHSCVTVVHNPRGVQGTNFSATHEYAYFVYRRGERRISPRLLSSDEISWSSFRNWGTESERGDAKNCFYPILVKNGEIIGFGKVEPDANHPKSNEVVDGVTHIYPIDRNGVERKWRYARQSVEEIAHLLRVKSEDDLLSIEIGKNFATQKTVWIGTRYDANVYGTKVVKDLVPDSPFDFPKSLWTVVDCINAVKDDDKNALVSTSSPARAPRATR